MFSKLALVAGAAALLATGSAWAEGFTLKAPPKAAFLFFKEKNDGGWTQAFEEARVKMEKALGMQIPYVENIPEDAAQIAPPAQVDGYTLIVDATVIAVDGTGARLARSLPELSGAGLVT